MLPSLDRPVEAVVDAVRKLPQAAREGLLANLLDQFAPDRPAPSARAQGRLDLILASVLPLLPLQSRLAHVRAFGALDLDLPLTLAVVEADADLVAEMALDGGAAEPGAVRALGRQRRFIDMRLIAARGDLSCETAEILAEQGDARTVRALAANGQAPLSARALDRLVTRATRDPALQERLCGRGDLRTDDVLRLVALVPDSLKARLFEAVDEPTARLARRAASEVIPAKVRRIRLERDGTADAGAAAAAYRAGTLSLAEALTMLSATDQVLEAVDILIDRLGLDRKATLAALGQVRFEPFEAVNRALALDEQVHLSLIEALFRRWRRAVPDRRGLILRYRRLSEEAIDGELDILRGARRKAPRAGRRRPLPAAPRRP